MDPIQKWNEKHKTKLEEKKPQEPNSLLTQLIPAVMDGTAVDLACGLGANSLHLAEKGYDVKAFDISDVAVDRVNKQAAESKLSVEAKVADLATDDGIKLVADTVDRIKSAEPGETSSADAVIMTYYLERKLFPFIKDLVKTEGYIFIETYVSVPGMTDKPVSEKYKLRPDELVNEFGDWGIVYFDFNEEAGIQTIMARKK
ncbi:methyltransferase domain-containing protein [Bacillus shivajii]|uniref:class I SAM-dependent methyltransferase n=1 Tax=Bacillus shivajii TaxID=1983719 RepID=UPI001CFA9FA7|nr:methyltransferase domain-containing protein [Bacillus shivajii]UCZ54979.1 methyltransferase domain-containing protein [Bacillus shivajii]